MARETKETYSESLIRILHNFRKDQLYCDATLVVEGKKFYAHRNILSASSSYFHKLFSQRDSKKKKSQVCVAIPEIALNVTEELLEYLYTGIVELKTTNVKGLIKAANTLELARLKVLGCEFLENELNLENCVRTFQFADKNECPSLRRASKEFINSNFKHVSSMNEAFLTLSSVQVEEFISDDDIVIEREEDVYEATLNWVKHDSKSRSIHFSRLFQHVRLTSVSKYYLHTNVGGEELVKVNRPCIEILLNAMKVVSLMPPESVAASPPFRPRKCLQQEVEVVIACGGLYEEEAGPSTLCFDTVEHLWYELAPISTEKHFKRWGHGMAVCSGFVYIMGGFYDDTKQVFSEATSVVKKYDAKTHSWSHVKSLNKATALLGVAVYRDSLYVVGGSNNGALKDVQKYVPESDVWELVAPLNYSRSAPCAVANDHHVFAVGGMQENGEFLHTAEMFSPESNTWSDIASMSTARAFACGVAIETKIYVIGGSTDVLGQNALSTCEMYDTRTGVWTQVASMHVPRFAAGVTKVGDKVYVFGGGSAGESFKSVESYSEETKEWEIEGDMPRAATHVQCSVIRIPKESLKSAFQSEKRK